MQHSSGDPGFPWLGSEVGCSRPSILPAALSTWCDSLSSFVLLTLDIFLANVTSLYPSGELAG